VALHIIVCIKQVPDWEAPADTFKIDPERKKIIPPPNIDPRISLFDEHAIEAALQLKAKHGGKVTVLTLGPDFAQRALKQAIAMGADEGILLKDPAFDESDTYATAYILAEAIKKIGAFDLILCGRQAADWDIGQVGVGISEYLSIPGVTIVQKIDVSDGKLLVERIVEGGYDVLEVELPALMTVSNEINKPRYPTLRGIMAAGRKQIPVWNAETLGVDLTRVGSQAAYAQMLKLYVPVHEAHCEFVEGESDEEKGEKLALRLREAKLI
ncbi:MAG: electron transfer flavoprotein subunit beta/FixA family protein, partial [Candidatus Entotheonellia bacterium]